MGKVQRFLMHEPKIVMLRSTLNGHWIKCVSENKIVGGKMIIWRDNDFKIEINE